MSRAHVRHAGARSAYQATRHVDTAGAWRRSGPRRAAAATAVRQRVYETPTAPVAAYHAAYQESPRHQPVRSEYAYRTQRPVRPSYGGSGQSYRSRRYAGQTQSHAAAAPAGLRRDYAPARYRTSPATGVTTAYQRHRHDTTPYATAAYARTSYRRGRPYQPASYAGVSRRRPADPAVGLPSRGSTVRPSARHAAYARTASPYHLHGGYGSHAAARRANPARLSAATPRHIRGAARVTGAGRPDRTGAMGVRRTFRGAAPTRYRTAAPARAHAIASLPDGIRVRRGPGLRDRLGHATTMMVSNATQAGTDRTDIADSMGHTATELAARTGMTATGVAVHAVGRTAGVARTVMTSDRRAMLSTYKAEKKASRQLDKALRKGRPGAARTKRIADSKKLAGKPTILSDAKPSVKIGRLAAKGKASRLIGKHVGGGLRTVGKSVKRLGATGMDWMDEASAKLTEADDDFASRLGNTTRDLTFKATRKGARGVTSSAKFIWRHRRAPVKAARGAKATGRAGARVIRAAANLVRAAASRIAVGTASISLPVVPVIAAMLAVLGVLMAVMAAFLGSSASADTVANVPAEYEADVLRAGSICQVVTPSVIAAQIDQESGWNPKAGSGAGAQGIAQFMPSTWASVGKDGDGDGKADIWNPHDAIWSQGNYMCGLASKVEAAKKSGKLTGDTLELTLAAYNAGLGSVLRYGMVPPFEETINYVRRIKELAATKYTSTGTAEGGTVGSLEPKLTVSDGIVSTAGITPDTRYPWGQCTWWAATRRADIGKPIPGWGNAATWAGSAASAGYTVDGSPSAGSVVVFQPGVLGAAAYYGHVAMVEEVRKDGSILISESNALGLGVVSTREISASQLAAAGGGVSYIH